MRREEEGVLDGFNGDTTIRVNSYSTLERMEERGKNRTERGRERIRKNGREERMNLQERNGRRERTSFISISTSFLQLPTLALSLLNSLSLRCSTLLQYTSKGKNLSIMLLSSTLLSILFSLYYFSPKRFKERKKRKREKESQKALK